jgi:hypothetical protein
MCARNVVHQHRKGTIRKCLPRGHLGQWPRGHVDMPTWHILHLALPDGLMAHTVYLRHVKWKIRAAVAPVKHDMSISRRSSSIH